MSLFPIRFGGGSTPPAAEAEAAVEVADDLPGDALIILAMRNVVLFPGMIVPVTIGRPQAILASQAAERLDRPVGILLQTDPAIESPGPSELHDVGTTANILRHVDLPDGSHILICQGLERFRVLRYLHMQPFPLASFETIPVDRSSGSEVEGRFIQLREVALEVLQLQPQSSQEVRELVMNIHAPGELADLIAGVLDLEPADKQTVLETFNLIRRLDLVLDLLAKRREVLRISREVEQRTRASLDWRQREFLLREQLKSIRKELGEGEEASATELEDLRTAIAAAGMPEDVERQAGRELKRLERMSENAAESSMLRTYLEWLTDLPWKTPPPDAIDIAEAQRILDTDHFGLEQIKKRIVEFLAVRKLNPAGHSPILCFVGPPGVGKTSLGQSIARALGRPFVRVSLGGVHDEAEIRGHRRTYIGALPGNILQAVRKAGARNCVMMLDEIDKLGSGIQGSPAAALLEVLDPEQNHSFRDNYLALPYDLSSTLFLTTANVLDTVPPPLRDRMEVIPLPGYALEEKIEIARRYLIDRQCRENGLDSTRLTLAPAALTAIIRDYTREAGVRTLERQIAAVCRHAALAIAGGRAESMTVDTGSLHDILGPVRFENEVPLRTGLSGVATGLAWTPEGGDILFIEASRTAGNGALILTGQLGDVMKESAQAALTLAKTRLPALCGGTVALDKADIHIHVPAGAIPKDGPSAGVAIFIALASLLTDRPARSDTALTGEISLRGKVLPVGGIKEKILAAMRAGIARVILPARNQRDLEELPRENREKLQLILIDDVDGAFREALTDELPPPRPAAIPARIADESPAIPDESPARIPAENPATA